MTYSSGPNKGQIRTEKVTFYREPVQEDYDALARAEQALLENWDRWEAMDLIPDDFAMPTLPEKAKPAKKFGFV